MKPTTEDYARLRIKESPLGNLKNNLKKESAPQAPPLKVTAKMAEATEVLNENDNDTSVKGLYSIEGY